MLMLKLTCRAKLALGICVVAACAIAAGVSYAAIPAVDGTISACVKPTGEIQKLVDTDAGETCTGSKRLVTWNQQGPAGPQGMPGISGYEIVPGFSEESSANSRMKSANCPASKKVLGGGATATYRIGSGETVYSNAKFVLNQPAPNGSGWVAQAEELTPDGTAWTLAVYAICATVSA